MNKTPHQMAQEAKIVRILFNTQLGHREVAQAMGLSRSGAQKYMDRMHAERAIYIAGHEHPRTGGQPRPLFSAGRKPDVKYEPDRIRKPKREVKQSDVTRARIVAALAKPLTGHEAGAVAFVSYEQAMKYIKGLREQGKVFIYGWCKAPGRGQWAAQYMAGNKQDVPHPGKESRASRYKKERANLEYVQRDNKRRALDRMVKNLAKRPVSPFAALGV